MLNYRMAKPAINLESLRSVLPDGQILTSSDELLTYERDASLEQGCPDAVVFPQSTDEVIKIVQ
jgi:FAD/FMN-containing dehydrogenase